MIAGHAPLAFAIVAAGAHAIGEPRDRAVLLGLVAGGFALVPDVDMAYAAAGVLGAGQGGVWGAVDAFWTSSKLVHRDLSHSLVIAVPAIIGFTAATTRRFRRPAFALLAGVIVVGGLTGGILAGAIMGLYVGMGLLVALGATVLGLGPRALVLTAAVGMGTHPFGDVFTGTPPAFLAPLGIEVLAERIVIHPDPTLNLLAIFGLELLCLWAALTVGTNLADWSIRSHVDWRAAAGAGYGVTALVMPAPTLDVSYHFVFSVLAVGSVGVAPVWRHVTVDRLATAAVTGLTAVTIGGLAYTAVYLIA